MTSYCVLQVSPEQAQKMKTYYQANVKQNPPAHALFAAKLAGVTITAYNSGKVVFQGKTAQTEAARWEKMANTATKQIPATKNSQQTHAKATPLNFLPHDFASWSVIGSDEVGNGSYFGPLVVCAAYVSSEKLSKLQAAGVRDSKELSDQRICELAAWLKTEIPFKLLTLLPEKYNQIQPKYNANHMKAVLHNQAIALLLEKIAPEKPAGILIDQFTPEKTFRRYIANEPRQVTEKIYFVTKGEKYHLAVAAASILCRAAFLAELEKESQAVGVHLPSGAGAKVDQVAARILAMGGEELLGKCAKLHFANTQKARQIQQRQ